MVINHPSGDLTPSEADLSIAGRLDAFRVAFYIVNNAVTDIYVVVEPFEKREKIALDGRELAEMLGPAGPIAKTLPGFENRPQQGDMAQAVVTAFNEDKIATIEAGTGTGKTLAYLAPAIQWALQNKERVVVSTNTINLQEQLVKDIPFLQTVMPQPFSAVLVKGRGNYACLRKVYEADSELIRPMEERGN